VLFLLQKLFILLNLYKQFNDLIIKTMNNKNLSSTNLSFDFLRNSKDFLNIILNNLSCAVLLLNKDMELHAFNDPLKNMFINKPNEHLLYKRCGEAIGCAFAIKEMKRCGETNHCRNCELRTKALEAYIKKQPVYRKKISREFYKTDSKRDLKHLQFSVLPFHFDKEYYIVVLVEDITEVINLKEILHQN